MRAVAGKVYSFHCRRHPSAHDWLVHDRGRVYLMFLPFGDGHRNLEPLRSSCDAAIYYLVVSIAPVFWPHIFGYVYSRSGGSLPLVTEAPYDGRFYSGFQ